ncbi:MAG: branched-chain amino acid ABC transporter permease [Acidobacteriota bacterium]|nr:branched-chain amino acid ABC transporter permease [Acidobacteriota bacterium]
MSYSLHLVNLVLVYGLATMGLSFCAGHVGQLSMAQAASFGVGAYTYAVFAVAYAWPPWAALCAAAGVAVAFSFAPGFIARALTADEFVFGTLAFNVMVAGLLYNGTDGTSPLGSLRNLTNGPYGITNVPPLLSRAVGDEPWLPTVAAAIVVAALLAGGFAALRSPWGRLLHAIRDSPNLALSLGKKVPAERARAAEAASVLGSMAGALYAAHLRYVDPGVASTDQSVFFLTCLLLGGATNLWGPLLGSAGVVLLPEALRLFPLDSATVAHLRVIGYAVALLMLLHLRPAGILSPAAQAGRKVER